MKTDIFFKQQKKYKVNPFYLRYFINEFWFIPSDILQRGMEANIWSRCVFKAPILDVGIGNGKLTNFLFKNHPQIDFGIDIEKSGLGMAKKLEMAKGKKRYNKVIWANAEEMPFKDASFHTVISNSTFEHISKDLKAVNEVARVLKKDGLFFLTVPSEYLQEWISEYEKENDNNHAYDKVAAFNNRTAHLHYRSLSTWKKQFKKNDMELVFYKYYFPKKIALYWYKMFRVCTYSIQKRELWSYIGHSKMTKLLPKALIKRLLKEKVLRNAYKQGFFTEREKGAQLFMIAKKTKN